jgi:deoxyribonuclease V
VVLADDPRFAVLVDERVCWLPNVAAYQPGRFFARELPALRAVLDDVGELALVVIDGYVYLDLYGRAGLGAYLHVRIHVPVIGVAKTAFRTAAHAIAVHRGTAIRPWYVTSVDIPAEQASALVTWMAGPYRLPDALRRVDALACSGHPIPPARPQCSARSSPRSKSSSTGGYGPPELPSCTTRSCRRPAPARSAPPTGPTALIRRGARAARR